MGIALARWLLALLRGQLAAIRTVRQSNPRKLWLHTKRVLNADAKSMRWRFAVPAVLPTLQP